MINKEISKTLQSDYVHLLTLVISVHILHFFWKGIKRLPFFDNPTSFFNILVSDLDTIVKTKGVESFER